MKEESADYYNGLQDRLDLVLTFTEQGSRPWARTGTPSLTQSLCRCLRVRFPVYSASRPVGDADDRVVLSNLFLDRDASIAAHARNGPAKRQGAHIASNIERFASTFVQDGFHDDVLRAYIDFS